MNARQTLGRQGEQLAAEHLQRSGLQILDRNWSCPEGEIDIVAAERRALVVCEVKTRSDTRFGTPLEAIGPRKYARLRRLGVRWVVANCVIFDEIRIDLIGVLRIAPGEFTIEHVRGVG
jgi:putative endonuclease